jgi:hypothetical protein
MPSQSSKSELDYYLGLAHLVSGSGRTTLDSKTVERVNSIVLTFDALLNQKRDRSPSPLVPEKSSQRWQSNNTKNGNHRSPPRGISVISSLHSEDDEWRGDEWTPVYKIQ